MRQHVFQLIVQLDVEEGKPKRKKAVQVELDLQPDHLDHGAWDKALQVLNVEMRLATIEVSVYSSHVGKTVPLELHLNAKGCPRNIHQKYGYHCWWRTCLGPFLAKTSRTAVLTAIMDLSAGGRLYKCLYKMHVASRAFWGAFWGAFRVFLRDVG